MSEIDDYQNPPGYGDTIGGCVLYDPPPHVIEAACEAFHGIGGDGWKLQCENYPDIAQLTRKRMAAAIEAAVRSSGTSD